MADFYQTAVVTTLHRLGHAKVDQLERDLERFTVSEPVALVLPCLIDELDRPALPHIVEHLRRVRYLDTVVVSLGRASLDGLYRARDLFGRSRQRVRIIWLDGPRVVRTLDRLRDAGLLPTVAGKGFACWLAYGLMLAEARCHVMAVHDCDIVTYDRELLARLCYPKAEAIAREVGIDRIYDDAEELLRGEEIDFVDVVTDPSTHARFVELAAAHGKAVICQKPMANDLATAEGMVRRCCEAGVPLFIHENWRFQAPIRAVKAVLDAASLGRVFRARLTMVSGFDLFANQPFLAGLEQFILTDMGSHVLDTARFLFGEAESLCCHTGRVHRQIRGEDVATVLLRMRSGASVTVELGYPGTPYGERESFPETFAWVEGDLFVSYGISIAEAINTIKLRYTINERWSLRAEAGVEQSADVEYRIER